MVYKGGSLVADGSPSQHTKRTWEWDLFSKGKLEAQTAALNSLAESQYDTHNYTTQL